MKYRLLVLALATISASASANESYNVVVYGGSSAGVIAAVQASRMGQSVVLIEPSRHVGGMTSSGLGLVDKGNAATIGGLAREFFQRVWLHYHPSPHAGLKMQFRLEPHVAEQIFDAMLNEAHVTIAKGERLDLRKGVLKQAGHIKQITMESGRTFEGLMFIDATYEGDLMAAAGSPYLVGRESNAMYGEQNNGIRRNLDRTDIPVGIDPFVIQGDPKSGLLPRISAKLNGADGAQDANTQAYNYRMCLTKSPSNRVMVEKPIGYNERDYEIVFRAIEAGLPINKFFKLDSIGGNKTDSNNFSAVSTDFIGMSTNYVEADYQTRELIAQNHELWQRGLIWTLQNHPRVPAKVKSYYAGYGLAKDEFTGNNHWPYQLYVREARRMIGETVMTEQHALSKLVVSDSVGLASYAMDSHAARYFVAPDGFVATEGEFYMKLPKPFPIGYRALVPLRQKVQNLLVPVALSATHVGYASIRMEPVFMILGQSAATAASLAAQEKKSIQDLDYAQLKAQLLRDGQIL